MSCWSGDQQRQGVLIIGIYAVSDWYFHGRYEEEKFLSEQARLIPDGFKGVVTYKIRERCAHIQLRSKTGDTVKLECVTEDLYENTKIGDTIVKYPNTNICTVIDSSIGKCFLCYYITQ